MAPPPPDSPNASIQLQTEMPRWRLRLGGEISAQWVIGGAFALAFAGLLNVWKVSGYFARLESQNSQALEQLRGVTARIDTNSARIEAGERRTSMHDAAFETIRGAVLAVVRDVERHERGIDTMGTRVQHLETR